MAASNPNPPRRRSRVDLVLTWSAIVLLATITALAAFPQYNNTYYYDPDVALMSNLATLRSAVELFQEDHDGRLPDEGIVEQLTATPCAWCGPDAEHVPYLRNGVYTNPITLSSELEVVDVMPETPRGVAGWLYCPSTGELRSDAVGVGVSGAPYWGF